MGFDLVVYALNISLVCVEILISVRTTCFAKGVADSLWTMKNNPSSSLTLKLREPLGSKVKLTRSDVSFTRKRRWWNNQTTWFCQTEPTMEPMTKRTALTQAQLQAQLQEIMQTHPILLAHDRNRPISNYVSSILYDFSLGIMRSAFQGSRFEIKPMMFQMLQTAG